MAEGIPGARTQKPRNVIRGSATTGPHGNGGGGPVDNGNRLVKPKSVVRGSKS